MHRITRPKIYFLYNIKPKNRYCQNRMHQASSSSSLLSNKTTSFCVLALLLDLLLHVSSFVASSTCCSETASCLITFRILSPYLSVFSFPIILSNCKNPTHKASFNREDYIYKDQTKSGLILKTITPPLVMNLVFGNLSSQSAVLTGPYEGACFHELQISLSLARQAWILIQKVNYFFSISCSFVCLRFPF